MGILSFTPARSREELLFNIDSEPSTVEGGTARLLGWVIHKKHPVSLVLELDGAVLYHPAVEHPRLDVVKHIPSAQKQPICGFLVDIPLEMLVKVGAGDLRLVANYADSSKVIWQWSGEGCELSDPKTKEALKAHFAAKSAGKGSGLPSSGQQECSSLHAVVDLRGSASIVRSAVGTLLSDLAATLRESALSIQTITALTDDASDPESVYKYTRAKFEELGADLRTSRGSFFPGWQSFSKESEEENALVLYLQQDVGAEHADLAALLRDFKALSQSALIMPAVFGASGIHAPKGVNLRDIRSRSSVDGLDVPALCSVNNVGPLWASTLSFLNELEKEVWNESSESGPIVLPPDGRFVYHADLRQPITCSNVGEAFHGERHALQHALDMHVQFAAPAVQQGPSVLAVIGCDWNDETEGCGTQFRILSLLRELEAGGFDIELVVDSADDSWHYIDGYAAVSIGDFCEGRRAYHEGYIVACSWQAIRAANVLRYVCGLPVIHYIPRFELQNGSAAFQDKLRLAGWAYHSEFLPLLESQEVLTALFNGSGSSVQAVTIPPVFNHEVFFESDSSREEQSVLFDLEGFDLWSDSCKQDVLTALAKLSDAKPDLHITAIGMPAECSVRAEVAAAVNDVFWTPSAAERGDLLRRHEVYVYIHGIAQFPAAVIEAQACAAVPVVCARSGAAEGLANDNTVFCPLSAISSQLSSTVLSTLEDGSLRSRIRQGAKRSVASLASKPAPGIAGRLAEAVRSTSKKQEKELGNKNPAALVIPVYGALDAFTMCIRSVLAYAPQSWPIIVVNDGSDIGTTTWLRELAKKFSRIELVDLEQNAGFVQACHAGLRRVPADHDMVLVNSDVVLTEGVLDRLQQGAYARERVGLASVLSTNSPHLQVDMNPGSELEDTAAEIAQEIKPQYPTIITPEGQLLYLRRWALDRFGFFDSAYNRGFCEESDLCLRMFLHGVDMVCADNAYMHHRRSASFGEEVRLDMISENRPLFDARWGRYYTPVYQEFLGRNPLQRIRRIQEEKRACITAPQKSLHPDDIDASFGKNRRQSRKVEVLGDAEVVFILPSIVLGGGTLSVLQHVDEMVLRGVKARVISLSRTDIVDRPYLSPPICIDYNAVGDLDWTNQKVVATFWTTAYVVKGLAERFKGLSPYYYIQDYEPWFYSRPEDFSAVEKAEKTYEFGFPGVAKTQYLADVVRERHGVDIEVITPGIDEYVFYPGEQQKHLGRPRLAAMYRPQTARRGSAELIAVLRKLKERLPELKVNLFGQGDSLPEDLAGFVNLMGRVPPKKVAALYRESDIVVDLSYWQGFGRMGLEGMSCGTVPVLSDSGGIHRYAEDGVNAFIVQRDDIDAAAERIVRLAMDRDLRMRMRDAGLKSAAGCREESAVDDWLRILGLEGSKPNPLSVIPDIRALVADLQKPK